MPAPPAVLAALGAPREAGTAEAAAARGAIAAHLTSLGYQVETQRFEFAPAALNAFPIFGAGLGWLAILLVPLLMIPGVPRAAALVAWLAGLAALSLLVRGVALGSAGRGAELREDANLIAVRPGPPIRRWIVAHTDTKAQGHSMAGRLVAVWVAIVAVVSLSAVAVLRLSRVPAPALVGSAAVITLAAGVLAGRGRLRGQTPGARDNASGVVAALAAAAAASPDSGTGVLLTGAEEFGLVGARIIAQTRPELVRGLEVVNIDTVDERGAISIVSHDAPGRALAGSLEPALALLGLPVRQRRLPLGIFVDSHPLARAGARAVTIARLDWATLQLIHTPRDANLSFHTAESVGRAAVAII